MTSSSLPGGTEAYASYANNVGNAYPDAIQQTASVNPVMNGITGTLGKFFDTALDALAIGAANKIIGSSYPTGQQDPAALAAKNTAAQAAAPFNWKPWAIGGGVAFVAIIALAVVLPRATK